MTDILNPASLIPAGTIVPYLGGAQASPPDGWLFCNGSYISRTTYGDLFAAIGTTYGFSSGSDFRLPNHSLLMRGSSSIGLGIASGNHTHTFAFGTSGNITAGNAHSHNMTPPSSGSGGSWHVHNQSVQYNSGTNSGNFLAVSGSANFLAGDTHTHRVYHTYSGGGGAHTHAGIVGGIGSAPAHSHSYTLPSSNYSSGSSTESLPQSIRLAHIIKT